MSSQDAPTARTDRRYRRRRGPALVVDLWAIAAVVAASGLPRLRADNAPERFFIRDARALARESKLTRELGAPAALRIGAAGQALWTAEGLRWLGDLEEELRGIRGVLGAAGIAGLRRAEGRPWPPTDPLQARDEARADPLTTNTGWISSDGEVATVLLLVRHLEPRARRRMLAEIGTSLAGAPPGVEAWMAGLPTINEALDDGISGLARTIFPAVLSVVLVVLAVALDGARDLLRPMVVVAVCLVTTFGLNGLCSVNWARSAEVICVVRMKKM
ncbi:MAG: MMPL family transporter, partial [Thermoanaerobaculia bacterium]|nr:MMPL family transporter [Thermoanaerobaculia bacterium]